MPNRPFDMGCVPVRVPHFLLERLDDELLLYHPEQTKTIRLNGAAALIWELCDGHRSAKAIVELLTDAYPDTSVQIQTDVEAALARLSTEGAIELR